MDQISSSEMTESVEEVTASTADVPRQVDELPHTWQVTGDMLEDPIVIAVMGVTGAGKSTFIKRIGGRRRTIGQEGVESEQPIIGHDTESETKNIEVYTLFYKTRRVILVDTPGFDDGTRKDAEILSILAHWLAVQYHDGKKLSGLIYLHPIVDVRFDQSARRNLSLFEKIIGHSGMDVLTLITTKWDKAQSDDVSGSYEAFEKRESRFREDHWAPLLEAGAKLERAERGKEALFGLFDQILLQSRGAALDIQKQMVDDKLSLANTAPGKVLMTESKESRRLLVNEKRLIQEQIARRKSEGKPFVSLEKRANDVDREIKELDKVEINLESTTIDSILVLATSIGIGSAGVWATSAGWAMFAGTSGLVVPPLGILLATVGVFGGIFGAVGGLAGVGGLIGNAFKRKKVEDDGISTESNSEQPQSPQPQTVMKVNSAGEPNLKRLSNPARYFEILEALHTSIFEESAFSAYEKSLAAVVPSDTSLDSSFVGLDLKGANQVTPLPSSSRKARELSAELQLMIASPMAFESLATSLYHLLQCFYVVQRALYNIVRLVDSGFVEDRLSILVTDPNRNSVARLVPLHLNKIQELINAFSEAAFGVAKGNMSFQTLTSVCKGFLSNLSISRSTKTGNTGQRSVDTHIWRCAAHTLDLAVVIYAGAHTRPLHMEFKDVQDVLPFHVPGPFVGDVFLDMGEKGATPYSSIVFQRPLQCLNGLLNEKVWVFHATSDQAIWTSLENEPLHLVTDARTLSDIWGPMWEVKSPDQSSIRSYQLGNGSIVPWTTPSELTLLPREVYCHWISDFDRADMSESTYDSQSSRISFSGTEQLLIGAVPKLRRDSSCSMSQEQRTRLTNRFHMGSRMAVMNATQETFLLESKTREVNAGISKILSLGIKVGGSFKRQCGQPWVAALIEQWDPTKTGGTSEIFDCLIGVEISACTENARRVSLSHVLLSDTMQQFFRPSDDDMNPFASYLNSEEGLERRKDPHILRKIWAEYKPWRPAIRQAVYASLNALRQTGFKDGMFTASWRPTGSESIYKVQFPKTSWMSLVADGVQSGCVAIVTNTCLEATCHKGRKCQSSQQLEAELIDNSYLETSIIVDPDDPPRGLQVNGTKWQVTTDSVKSVYSMGPVGKLEVVGILSESGIGGLQTKRVQSSLAWKEKRKAYEYTGDDPSARPLPILVQ